MHELQGLVSRGVLTDEHGDTYDATIADGAPRPAAAIGGPAAAAAAATAAAAAAEALVRGWLPAPLSGATPLSNPLALDAACAANARASLSWLCLG